MLIALSVLVSWQEWIYDSIFQTTILQICNLEIEIDG